MQTVIVTDKRGLEYKFEPIDEQRSKCVLERHDLEVMITRHTNIQPIRYTAFYKTKLQKTSRTHGQSNDFDKMITSIEKMFNSQHKSICYKLERKERDEEENKKFLASLKVGSILCSSWGYSMTIVDFFMVTKIKGSKVTLVELNNKYPNNDNGSLSGSKVVAGDVSTRSEPKEYMVRGSRVKINSSSRAGLWDGQPMYENRND